MEFIQWLQQEPTNISPSIRGGSTIEICDLEDLLDDCTGFDWSTHNFRPTLYFEHGENHCYGTIELVLNYYIGATMIRRTFCGAANFKLSDIHPNIDWCATLKSYCVKNAASDAGKKLGRGLNKTPIPEPTDTPPVYKADLVGNKIHNTLKNVSKK